MLPACTTACVCLEVPEAMFVNAQAASNCNDDLENRQLNTVCFTVMSAVFGKF